MSEEPSVTPWRELPGDGGRTMVGYGGDRSVLCNFGVEGWLLVISPEALTGIKSCNAVGWMKPKVHHCENGEAGEGAEGEKGSAVPQFHLSLTRAVPEELLPWHPSVPAISPGVSMGEVHCPAEDTARCCQGLALSCGEGFLVG